MKLSKIMALLGLTLLAACSGGGSNSLPPTPVPTVHPTSAPAQRATFRIAAGGTVSTQSNVRRVQAVRTQSLSAQPAYIGNFSVPDFASPLFPTTLGGSANAFYDTSTGPAPSPLPSVVWVQTGTAQDGLASLTTPPNSNGLVYVSSELISQGQSVGQTTVTATASNGDSAQVNSNTYRGTALGIAGNANGDPVGLTFDVLGSHAASSGADITLDASGDVTTVHAPGGIVIVNKPIDQVKAADFANAQPSVTANICAVGSSTGGYNYTLVFRTAAGTLVKYQPSTFVTPNASATCQWVDSYGPYAQTVAGVFSY